MQRVFTHQIQGQAKVVGSRSHCHPSSVVFCYQNTSHGHRYGEDTRRICYEIACHSHLSFSSLATPRKQTFSTELSPLALCYTDGLASSDDYS